MTFGLMWQHEINVSLLSASAVGNLTHLENVLSANEPQNTCACLTHYRGLHVIVTLVFAIKLHVTVSHA